MEREHLFGHFYIYEVGKSSIAARHYIDNSPTPEILENARRLAENCLEPIRNHFHIPFSPSSWYRSEPLERVICWESFLNWCKARQIQPDDLAWAKYFSRKSHPTGSAADCELPGIPNDYLFQWCKTHLEFDQLILEFHKPSEPNSGWVHISYVSPELNRNQVLEIG